MANLNLKAIITAEDRSGRTVDKFNSKLDDTGKFSGLAKTALIGLGVAAAGMVVVGFKKAITEAVAFDKAMRNVNSIAKVSEDSFKSMSDQVVEISKTLPQTAVQLSEALYDVYSSGFKGKEAMEVLEVAAKGASAGLTDTKTSGRALMGVMNAYNMKTGPDAIKIMDILFKTVDVGVLSFDELAQNLGDVVATSSSAKVPIGTVGAALATMTKKGINASEAVTALNMLILKFIQPTEAMGSALKELGYESGLTAIQTDGLNVVLNKLWVQSGKNVDAFVPLFGEVRAGKGALSLAADGGTEFATSLDAITQSSGATTAALNEQSKSTAYQYEIFKNKLNAALMEIGSTTLPFLNRAMGEVSKGIDKASDKLMIEQGRWETMTDVGSDAMLRLQGSSEQARSVIFGKFNWLWEKLKNGSWGTVVSMTSAFGSLIGLFHTIVQSIRNLWNRTIGGKGFSVAGINLKIPYLAKGGYAQAGQPYIVGEQGAELFVPSSSGRVVPNNQLGGASITVNFYGDLNNQQGMSVSEAGQAISRQIELAMMGAK